MGRKAFLADLQAASDSDLPPGFSSLCQGREDGNFTFVFTPTAAIESPITLHTTVLVDDYPSSHNAFMYVATDGAPTFVTEAVSDSSQFDGLKVSQIIAKIAKLFREEETSGSYQNPVNLDSDSNADLLSGADDDDSDEMQEDASDGDFDDTTFDELPAKRKIFVAQHLSTSESQKSDMRVRSELRTLKQAGFHVSCHGSPFNGAKDFYLTISCRIAKLNISEDALNAWGLLGDKYFLLIIHYVNGYRSLDQIFGDSVGRRSGHSTVEFRTAVCAQRKAPRQETIDIFSNVDLRVAQKQADETSAEPEHTVRLEPFFIDRPLNELMNNRFLDVLRVRHTYNFPWSGAENFCQDNQAMSTFANDPDKSYYQQEILAWNISPFLQIGDHFASGDLNRSFPLIAMEFTLRHLVHCTDFCLVCHTRLNVEFEALKPYVCPKPLCLYQYMALGFGPSMEHEILSQPYVVDLLVSFCYTRATQNKLTDLPVGLGMDTPDPAFSRGLNTTTKTTAGSSKFSKVASTKWLEASWTSHYEPEKEKITIVGDYSGLALKTGDWVALKGSHPDYANAGIGDSVVYRRVTDVVLPSVLLSKGRDKLSRTDFGNSINRTAPEAPYTPPRTFGNVSTSSSLILVFPFNHKFDQLNSYDQQSNICSLLDALPSVLEMKEDLLQNRNKSLSQLYPDIPPASLSILRWVIASNRSCIVAIDDPSSPDINTKDRVHGMPGYMQFRFAQGAPDKEQRFVAAVREVQAKTKKSHPTIWAWHGSPLHNWHSIIREGLHYNYVAHGRAYGNGVYHALDSMTSTGYAGRNGFAAASRSGTWGSSKLLISGALSLNEIVNAPDQFQSKSPYLVVQHVDWIQTRYLFVSCAMPTEMQACVQNSSHVGPLEILPQDSSWSPTGENGKAVILPSNAISASRLRSMESSLLKGGFAKRQKISGSRRSSELDALVSDATDDEDRFLVEGSKTEDSPNIIDLTNETQEVIVLDNDEEDVQEITTPVQERTGGKFSGLKSLVGWKRGKSETTTKLGTSKLETKPVAAKETDFVPGTLDLSTLPTLPAPPFATPAANKALAREVKALQKTQNSTAPAELGWCLCESALDNIYQWIVELHSFDSGLPLNKDLKSKGLTSVVLEIRFGPQFPFSPPFVRVVRPRFLDFRMGGGGHVTAGGAMCMELLTNDGWSAASSIEAVLLQVRMAICSTDPQPARLPKGPVGEYSAGEALAAYKRACMLHGWTVPPDFKDIESQDGPSRW